MGANLFWVFVVVAAIGLMLIVFSGGRREAAAKDWPAPIQWGYLALVVGGFGILSNAMSFTAVMLVFVLITGVVWGLDKLLLAKKRMAEGREVGHFVDYARGFFPVIFVVFVLRSFLVEPFQIPSSSMRPGLVVGDFILVNKFSYGIRLPVLDTKVIPVGDPQRGDVMVFRYPSDPNINYIKRVIGVPGDTIRYTSDKRLYVNDQLVAEKLMGEEPGSLGSVTLYKEKLGDVEHLIRKEMTRYRVEPGRQWKVPAEHYFMMGDNRDNSNDSRYWNDPKIPKDLLGMVPDRNIVGKAFAVWMSWPEPKQRNLPNFSRVGVIH